MSNANNVEATNTAKPHEMVRLHLDIGHCRYIHALLSDQLDKLKEKCIEDTNDALSDLVHRFERYSYPDESKVFHHEEDFDRYLEKSALEEPEALNSIFELCYKDNQAPSVI